MVEPVVEPATFSTNGEHLTSLSQNLPILLVMYCNCDLGIENNPPPQLRIWLNRSLTYGILCWLLELSVE